MVPIYLLVLLGFGFSGASVWFLSKESLNYLLRSGLTDLYVDTPIVVVAHGNALVGIMTSWLGLVAIIPNVESRIHQICFEIYQLWQFESCMRPIKVEGRIYRESDSVVERRRSGLGQMCFSQI